MRRAPPGTPATARAERRDATQPENRDAGDALMAGSPVARTGDVSVTAGSTPFTGATSGAWTASAPQLTTAASLSSDGLAVVTKATCAFTFSGSSGQSPVTGTSTVNLQPTSRRLTIAGVAPLVDGDSAKDQFGNTVSVSSNARLGTT